MTISVSSRRRVHRPFVALGSRETADHPPSNASRNLHTQIIYTHAMPSTEQTSYLFQSQVLMRGTVCRTRSVAAHLWLSSNVHWKLTFIFSVFINNVIITFSPRAVDIVKCPWSSFFFIYGTLILPIFYNTISMGIPYDPGQNQCRLHARAGDTGPSRLQCYKAPYFSRKKTNPKIHNL